MEKGDIVYWVSSGVLNDMFPHPRIMWGVVNEDYHSVVNITIYERKDLRTLEGVLLKDWEPDYHMRKLPKGWTWNTRLFEVEEHDPPADFEACPLSDSDRLKEYIRKGYLVPASENPRWYPKAEVTRDGWYIKKDYDERHITDVTLEKQKVYGTYEEAAKAVAAIEAELERQAGLTDAEWAEEEICKTVEYWARCIGEDPGTERVCKVRNALLALDRIEDVEVRVYHTRIQYRYWKRKRGIDVEPPEIQQVGRRS